MSATKYGFTRFDSINEFKAWLDKQPKYGFNGIQVHHTAAPAYKHFYKANGTTEDELTRQNNMKSYHVKTNGWADIAQHFTIFPNGRIVTGRPLSNLTPVGISGWNSKKICIEIYGNFDKGQDIMNAQQKEAVIACYALLCKKFGLTPSTSTIRPHAWFTSSGTFLGTYVAGKSRKTCPGTNFMGIGNTKDAFINHFYPMIKNYMDKGQVSNPQPAPTPAPKPAPAPSGKYIVRYLQQVLNSSYGLKLPVDGLYGSGTQSAVKAHILKQGAKGDHVVWLQKALINRGHKITADGIFGPATLKALKAYQASRKLTADGIAGLATHTAIIND